MGEITVRGVGASPGVASGIVVFEPEDAVRAAAAGEDVIFVRMETSSEDVAALKVAVGVVATRGGLTGDAAIVARALKKPCAIGFSTVSVIYSVGLMRIARAGEEAFVVRRGDRATLDGSKGTMTFGA